MKTWQGGRSACRGQRGTERGLPQHRRRRSSAAQHAPGPREADRHLVGLQPRQALALQGTACRGGWGVASDFERVAGGRRRRVAGGSGGGRPARRNPHRRSPLHLRRNRCASQQQQEGRCKRCSGQPALLLSHCCLRCSQFATGNLFSLQQQPARPNSYASGPLVGDCARSRPPANVGASTGLVAERRSQGNHSSLPRQCAWQQQEVRAGGGRACGRRGQRPLSICWYAAHLPHPALYADLHTCKSIAARARWGKDVVVQAKHRYGGGRVMQWQGVRLW